MCRVSNCRKGGGAGFTAACVGGALYSGKSQLSNNFFPEMRQ